MIGLYLKIPEKFVRLIFQDWFWVVYIVVVRMIKFKLLAQFPEDKLAPPSRILFYSLFTLIYCTRLLCDWSFRLYYHIIYICYFVASCLFLLWHSWSLWGCFVLLLEKSLFLLVGFPFLAKFSFSRVRFRGFVARNVFTVVFLPIFFLLFSSLWVFHTSVC